MYVINDEKKYPFSKGILAKSIYQTGVPLEEAYDIVSEILAEIPDDADRISSKQLKERASKKLVEHGWREEDRFYWLGIERIVGTDTVREIMRGILSPELVPTLHESTYNAMDQLKTPYITDKLIYAFSQQVSLVNKGIGSVIDRGMKEGLDMIVDGVHIVPGYLRSVLASTPKYLFQYVIDVPDADTHKRHFYSREKDSLRDPERYLDNYDRIHRIHQYILEMAEERNVRVLENSDLTLTIDEIISDTVDRIEADEKKVGRI